jgi:hypothetical protein
MFACLSWGAYGMGLLDLARPLCARLSAPVKFGLMAESSIMAKSGSIATALSHCHLDDCNSPRTAGHVLCHGNCVVSIFEFNLDLLRHVLQKLHHLLEDVLDNPAIGAGRSTYHGIPPSRMSYQASMGTLPPIPTIKPSRIDGKFDCMPRLAPVMSHTRRLVSRP